MWWGWFGGGPPPRKLDSVAMSGRSGGAKVEEVCGGIADRSPLWPRQKMVLGMSPRGRSDDDGVEVPAHVIRSTEAAGVIRSTEAPKLRSYSFHGGSSRSRARQVSFSF